jgi:hypothetical protein
LTKSERQFVALQRLPLLQRLLLQRLQMQYHSAVDF